MDTKLLQFLFLLFLLLSLLLPRLPCVQTAAPLSRLFETIFFLFFFFLSLFFFVVKKPNAKCCTSCGRRVAAPAPAAASSPASVSSAAPALIAPIPVALSSAPRQDSAFNRPQSIPSVSPPNVQQSQDVCSGCQFPLKPNAKFCTNCGKKPERVGAVAAVSPPSIRLEPSAEKKVEQAVVLKPQAALVASESSSHVVRRKSVRKKTALGRNSTAAAAAAASSVACESCGHQLKDKNVVFCTKCGVKQSCAKDRLADEGQKCSCCQVCLRMLVILVFHSFLLRVL